ncbi:HU family DNA-binding protein [Lactobacillus johnsonii]|uniref:DNA-binding protein HU n=1 Tax=Lactobacillus johnsonii TaxID=33959 RepID=A0A9X5AME7_LACJH|nr:HU family DNA-binding protein [Lactobacillus taiwanensis]MTE03592.1 HU family DNA-binding protein [Lactobacillus johnsonii]
MSKTEFIKMVATETDSSQKDVAKILDSAFNIIEDEVAKGNKIRFIGFGSFESRERSARKGRNPQTGAEIEIPATNIPAFKAGKEFKDRLKNK